MKYVQPYGISDPEASYINGNPSTGTMGSIPPAESIEHPQREVVNLIKSARFTATGTDLTQLGKAVQSGQLNYAPNTGVAGAAIAAISPVPDAYSPGLVVRFKALIVPTGPTTLDAGRGPNPIIKPGGGPMTGGEWFPGDIVMLTNDGAGHWFLPGMPVAMLFANRDYYVSMAGSDSNNGTSGSPFLTLQHAWNVAQQYNLNGFNVTIHVADGGPYAAMKGGPINGSGNIFITGNVGNPQNVTVQASAGPAFGFGGAANVTLNGMRLSSLASTPAAGPGCGVIAANGGVVYLLAVDFAATADAHIIADIGGAIGINGPIRIVGNASAHLYSYNAGAIRVNTAPLTILNPVAFSAAFASCRDLSSIQCQYSSITGPASVTGPKYLVTNNGVINTSGGGANYLPGNIAGTQTTGGQYV